MHPLQIQRILRRLKKGYVPGAAMLLSLAYGEHGERARKLAHDLQESYGKGWAQTAMVKRATAWLNTL